MRKNIFYLLVYSFLVFQSCETQQFDEDGALVPLTVMEDSTIPSIEINKVLLHSETYGNPSDPMIVVLHGGPGGDYRGMLHFSQLAEDSLFVVFYDQRGSGLSERLDKNGYSEVQVYIDELDGVIHHYRHSATQKVILAGHSWGAMLATAYINQNPDAIDGAILAEPGGFTWPQVEAYFGRSRALKIFEEPTNDFVYQDQFITSSEHNTLDYKLALSNAGNVGTGDATAPSYWRYGAICNTASLELAVNNPDQMDFTTHISAFDTEILFAYSELNSAYGKEHAELVSGELQNVQLVEILSCGHEIPEFGWDNFYPFITSYLQKIL